MSDTIGTERRVLVVDDERPIREMLADALETMGYQARAVGSAEEALAAIAEERPALVMSDIEMPDTTGLELLERVKAIDADIDVIMVTGLVDAQTAIEAIRRGAADYLTKPFNLDEVQIIVDRALEKQRLVAENRAYQEHLEELVDQRTQKVVEQKREIERLFGELETSYESTLQALVTALDFRDNETQGHSYRVVQYAMRVADKMDVDGEDLTWIRFGAILHDVGKIGIPDSILRKPGKLDEQEWVEMKRHPEMGYRMLQHIPFLEPALDIVLCHQERFDGTGYPKGLAGDAIPFGARIFAVVDTFDAMTSDRPYRAALSIAAARAEIREWSGRQFDPVVAEAFLSIDEESWHAIRKAVHEDVAALEEQVRRVVG